MSKESIKKELIEKCQENGWLKKNGYEFQDGFLEEQDCPYYFKFIETREQLKEAIGGGCYAIRQTFVFHDLAFINQVNGGDEYWTLKKFGNEWIAFESITFCAIIENEEFETLIDCLQKASREQCETLTYM